MSWGSSFNQGLAGAGILAQSRMLRDQLQTYPDLLQAQLANQQALTGINQNTLQYAPQTSQANIGLTNAQAQQAGANAGYINTEAGKNQFLLDNPSLMIPGVGGTIGGIATAQKLIPGAFGMNASPVQQTTSGASTTGQIMPPSNPNQGGLAQLNGGMATMPQPNVPIMMQGVPGGGTAMPPIQLPPPSGMGAPPTQNPVQQMAQGGSAQMFGGNPLANQLLQASFAPMNKDLAMTNYYNARGAQLQGQMAAGKNPMMGSMTSGAGGTYVNPTTGQVISTDTGTQTTRDQRTIAGLQNAQQYLTKAMQTLPQFVTGWQKLGTDAAGLSNSWLGSNYAAPSQRAGGEAALRSAAEGILNGFGLNSTGENVQFAEKIMTPVSGESSEYYQARVMNQLADFADQQHRASDRLAQGTDVTPQNATSADNAPAQVTFNPTGNTSATVLIQGADGKQWNIPAKNLQAALKRGAKQVQ